MKSRKVTKAICKIYIILLIWIICLKMYPLYSGMLILGNRSINLIPFNGARITGKGAIDSIEMIYNIGIFIPLGIFLMSLGKNQSYKKATLCIVLASVSFEFIQFVFGMGATDITDVLMNTFGGMVGLWIYYSLQKYFGNRTITVINYMAVSTLIILLSAITIYAYYLKVII